MRRLLVLAVLLALGRHAIADPPSPTPKPGEPAPPAQPPAAPVKPAEKPLTPEQAADAVLSAVKAKDDVALKALAAKDDPDPWLVADELIHRGEFDPADAFAKAEPRVDVEKLPAYVASRRGKTAAATARKALALANTALAAKKPQEALDAIGAAPSPESEEAVGIRLAIGRGLALRDLNRLQDSAAAFLVAAEAAERVGWLAKASDALYEAAMTAHNSADHRGALSAFERCFVIAEARGNRSRVAAALGNIGNAHYSLGNFAKALEYQERALAMKEALGERPGLAATLGNIGNVYYSLGSYAKALEYHERALQMKYEIGNLAGAAGTLGNIGNVHYSLGNYARALEYYEQASKMSGDLGDRVGAARALVNLGNVHQALASYDRALESFERAVKMKEEFGDRAGVALALGGIGSVYHSLGNLAKALEYQGMALKRMEDLGEREGVANIVLQMGLVHAALGTPAAALPFLERATREAERLRADGILAQSLQASAAVRLEIGEHRAALDAAHRATTVIETLLTGLAEEEGLGAREQHAGVYAVGALAAARLADAGEACYFIESGRAGSQVEALGGRQAMRWQGVPEALHAAQIDVRAEEGAALAAYTRALQAGVRQDIAAASKALDAARDRVRDVVSRIQREVKRGANIWYPRAATIEEIRNLLEATDSLVLYVFSLEEAFALVLTRDGARIVALGKVADVAAACDALHIDDFEVDAAPALAALRKLLIEPLKIPESATRLMVSPEGPLSYLPFAAIAIDRTVVYEPSGTTYGLLLEEAKKRGEGVLALGDPAYEGAGSKAEELYWRGRRLQRLPATGEEARAVGDVSLLGAEASEAGLRAALPKAKGGRWRALHLACHGLVDPERPTLSSLALSRDAANDGFLTALEVLDLDVPTDLAVLSACETGKGKIVKGEGIVGLTRAFMYAGAPRVICSLWKVDDDATRALMVKFYSLWNPKDGSKPMGTAAALKAAQEYIRDNPKHPEWKHPYYWAAWVLWGLPD